MGPLVVFGDPGVISWGTWTFFIMIISLPIGSRVFHNMACRLHGKLIFMHWASTFDAKTCHGPILGTVRNFSVPKGVPVAMAKQWRSNEEAMARQWGICWVAF